MKFDILSERGYMHWASWDVVYEWEDIIAERLGCDILTFRKGMKGKFVRRGTREINSRLPRNNSRYRITKSERVRLLFVMSTTIYRDLPVKNIIPIFLDFPTSTLDEIELATKRLPVFFVTCLDIYNMLKNRNVENVRYIPLSISDKYYQNYTPDKTIDVIQFGRKNVVLHEYMMRYCAEHPETEYVYQTADGSLTYYSTTRGNIGKFGLRSEYIDLIRCCKVSLVSSPGCDKGRSAEFGSIDFISPRFYESAALYCHLVGRYTQNEESRRIGLNEICPCVQNYADFERILKTFLKCNDFDWSMQREFVKKNLTSERAKDIQREMYNLKF